MLRGDCTEGAVIDQEMLLPLTVPSLLTAFLGGTLVLGGQAYFILTGLLLVAAAGLMVFKRTADTVEVRRVRAFSGRRRGCRSRIHLGTHWGRRRSVPDAPAHRLRLGVTQTRGSPFTAVHPLQFRGGIGGCLACWTDACPRHAALFGRRSCRSRHRHRPWPTLDVGTCHTIRSCGNSSVCRSSPVIPISASRWYSACVRLVGILPRCKSRFSDRQGLARGLPESGIGNCAVAHFRSSIPVPSATRTGQPASASRPQGVRGRSVNRVAGLLFLVGKIEQRPDFLDGKAEVAGAAGEGEAADMRGRVVPVVSPACEEARAGGRCARSSGWFRSSFLLRGPVP